MTERKVEQGILVSERAYNSLLKESRLLDALIAYGVDNWEGYSLALASVSGDEEDEEGDEEDEEGDE